RLTPAGRKLGIVDDVRWRAFERKHEALATERARLDAIVVRPGDVPAASALSPLTRDATAASLLRRPDVAYAALTALERVGTSPALEDFTAEEIKQIERRLEIDARYAGYIERQGREIERARSAEAIALPDDLDYAAVRGLSNEVREKLARIRPATIGQAGRVAGMTPAAISLLLVHLRKDRALKQSA
ncbi:MAG: tRNA uridine-5-carboxymethylaminomethyl(34) synthesis enzyme MnmG, partial [Gammaproteobacteria bacterium]|nr:tRNA uridine-5-carboxymethylaminomethyl(34) synthesis enzyme MnmG [Gammaproteobacteria bacterium]